ncbi:MAG: hypothetical protein LKI32_01280 [Lachnospiraceae bacterium]|uniref:hypothetical protein n=1 Tax=Clostridium sp. (strain SY8519) TaxID=1042156 RepID=UPI0002171F22|nr:hypothetical protein [Clostridium sp. SY8519]MCI1653914.1 hypothetical protein [Lachnospiraceae bacterium]MCI1656176.1 hypothetical protein [Lachnospiraceae bacterium]MCI2194658.1 hypothetical protein [Lachnospiraceae bacterium]BAK47258.1 hypothetical protein CXIVA_12920 [Clostridium sp. SY8519]HAD19015.1 hypothetical protein [Lachnospiraceae bacterium]
MGLFNRNSDTKIERSDDDVIEAQRIQALAKNIYNDGKNTVLAYDEENLILEYKRRHDEFVLDGASTLLTYTCEDRMMGTREIGIWEKDLKDKRAGAHPAYKKSGSITFSKKDSDTFFHLYHDIKNCLTGKALFFTPETEFDEISFDSGDQILEFADGHRTYYIEYKDIIGADLNTNTKTITTTKTHVGKTRVSSSDNVGINGAEGKQDASSTTTIESYDLVIYLDDDQFLLMKKHYEANEGDDVQRMFQMLRDIIGE